MPNWSEGNIRIRGNWKNIMAFLESELVYVGTNSATWDTMEFTPVIELTQHGEVVISKPKEMEAKADLLAWQSLYIKDTKRNFIDGISGVYLNKKAKTTILFLDSCRAAWGFQSEPYLEKARKYNVDIKIIAYERGMQFKQVIEIVDGEIVQDEDIQYNDWDWEAECPNMGG